MRQETRWPLQMCFSRIPTRGPLPMKMETFTWNRKAVTIPSWCLLSGMPEWKFPCSAGSIWIWISCSSKVNNWMKWFFSWANNQRKTTRPLIFCERSGQRKRKTACGNSISIGTMSTRRLNLTWTPSTAPWWIAVFSKGWNSFSRIWTPPGSQERPTSLFFWTKNSPRYTGTMT